MAITSSTTPRPPICSASGWSSCGRRATSQEPATDEFARLCEHVWLLPDTVDRLVAVYRVLEPHLVSSYVYHADATDPLTDTPTVRLLRQLAAMGQSHVAWGQAVLDGLTRSPEDRRRALDAQADIEARLVDCGGVTGQGIESHWLTFHSAQGRGAQPRRGSSAAAAATGSASAARRSITRWSRSRSGSRTSRRISAVYQTEDEWSLEGFRHKFHQLLYGEVETTDRMGKMLAEFPDLPWEMRMELAHQMWDEARHIEIVAKACRGGAGRRARLRPLDAGLVVDAERTRPAAPDHRHQQLGRGAT